MPLAFKIGCGAVNIMNCFISTLLNDVFKKKLQKRETNKARLGHLKTQTMFLCRCRLFYTSRAHGSSSALTNAPHICIFFYFKSLEQRSPGRMLSSLGKKINQSGCLAVVSWPGLQSLYLLLVLIQIKPRGRSGVSLKFWVRKHHWLQKAFFWDGHKKSNFMLVRMAKIN